MATPQQITKQNVEEILTFVMTELEKVTTQVRNLNRFAKTNGFIIDWIGLEVLDERDVCQWKIVPPYGGIKEPYATTCGQNFPALPKGNVCPNCKLKIYDHSNAKFK